MKRTISATYENGSLTFRETIKLKRKLPLRDHTRLRFTIIMPSTAESTFGLLKVPKRLARLIAESPEFSVLNT